MRISCASRSTPGRMSRRWRRSGTARRRRSPSTCRRTTASRSIVAPHVNKIRYNPGHLWHHERDEARTRQGRLHRRDRRARTTCAIRVGVNCGSVDPAQIASPSATTMSSAMVASALEHCDAPRRASASTRYIVSLKDSDWRKVVEAQSPLRGRARPDVPLHLGVTEAGMLPEGEIKTRAGLRAAACSEGIGDTVRVSLTLPFEDKGDGDATPDARILADIESAGRFRSDADGPRRRAQHHLLPVLLASGERGLHRAGPCT